RGGPSSPASASARAVSRTACAGSRPAARSRSPGLRLWPSEASHRRRCARAVAWTVNPAKGEAVATFLTQDETGAIRRHIDDHRRPGTYEPGKWSVGHNNRRPEVLGLQLPDHYPERVRLRDIVLRTIEQTPGVAVTRPERKRLARALVEAGVPSLQLSFGSYKTPIERLRAEVEAIRQLDPEVEITSDGAAVEEDVDRAAEAGFDVVQFLSPSMPGISPIYLHEAHYL